MKRGLFRPLAVLAVLAAGGMGWAQSPAPVITPDAPVMRLDELGWYDVGYTLRGQAEVRMPTGWSGDFDAKTGLACRPEGVVAGSPAFLIHVPWKGATGAAFQQFRFELPPGVRSAHLRGATAMKADAVAPGKSDGVTFRIVLNGRQVLDEHRTDAAWKPFDIDLTDLAGKVATLRFEVDPGPSGNSSFDFSLWGDRRLEIEGLPAPRASTFEPPPLDLTRLAAPATSVVPPSAFEGTASYRRDGDAQVLAYQGPDGRLDYRWTLPNGDDAAGGLLGHFELTATPARGDAATVPLAQGARIDWKGEAKPVGARWAEGTKTPTMVRTFRVDGQPASLAVAARIEGKSLVLDVRCDQPLVEAFEAGGFGPTLRRKPMVVPFYSGQVEWLAAVNLFTNTFLDWTASAATQHERTRASYQPFTDGSRCLLAERVVYAPGWHLAEALPGIPNRPSPFHEQVARRLVLDVWGPSFDDTARALENLADHGIRDGIVLLHVWQRDGYDNGLPAHFPANAKQGGDEAMKRLVATGTRLGHLFALHENYVDYYPNYEHFRESDIALDSKGAPQKAWFNEGTGIQSFAVAPDAMLRLAESQSPEIHRRYATNANYLDVNTAVPPWFHVDQRAGSNGAGQFARVWERHGALFDFERSTHGGPVFGEGNNHWYWSGRIDGAEAQFGSGWPGNAGLTAPLAVDFDLLRIHPLQVNHGMGYYERWWSKAEGADWHPMPPMAVLDRYRVQTLAYGHAPFLAGSTYDKLPVAWQEFFLASPASRLMAGARPTSIRYEVNGKWVDGSEAARAGVWDRLQVAYDNGSTFTANQAEEPLTVGSHVLPTLGWVLEAPGFEAGTTQRDGVMADFVDTGSTLFANARPVQDWDLSGGSAIRPSVGDFAQVGPRTIRFRYDWKVDSALDREYVAFVHFGKPGATSDKEGGILFQQDHTPTTSTRSWAVGRNVADGPYDLKIPDTIADGTYDWSVGLYQPRGGGRVRLLGPTDAQGRRLLGHLTVSQGGKQVTFEPAADTSDDRAALYARNLNTSNRVVEFGPIATDGSVAVQKLGNEWVLRPWPCDRAIRVWLDAKRFPAPAAQGVRPDPKTGRWQLPIVPGTKEYRWPAS
jgi:hypothetical protein